MQSTAFTIGQFEYQLKTTDNLKLIKIQTIKIEAIFKLTVLN